MNSQLDSSIGSAQFPEKIRLLSFIEEIATAAEYIASRKGLRFHVHNSLGDLHFESDPKILRLILLDLLDKAVTYTPRGFVQLGVKILGSDLVFDVVDTGPGLFAGGKLTGLNHLAKLLNGEAKLIESREHQGSHFRLHIPLSESL
jgi:signal transduction histidine kinase